MTLDILHSSDSQLIETVRCFGPTFITENFPLPTAGAVAYHGDIFGRVAVGEYNFALRLPLKTVRSAFYIDAVPSSYERLVVSYPVENFTSAGYDEHAYGDVFRNAYRVLLHNFARIDPPSLEGEHYARHFTFSGQLMPASEVIDFVPDDLVTHRYTLTGIPRLTRFFRRGLVSNLDPLVMSYQEGADYSVPKTFDFLAFLRRLQDSPLVTDLYLGLDKDNWVYGSDWRSTVSNVDFHFNSDLSFLVTYHTDVTTSQGVTYAWNSRLHLGTNFTFTPTIPQPQLGLPSGMLWLVGSAPISFVVSGFTASANTFRFGAPDTCDVSHPSQSYRDYAISLPMVNDVSKYNIDWARGVRSAPLLESLRNDFRKAVQDDWHNFLPSATFSTVDAIGNMEGSVNNNVLQTLAKIPDIANSLPDIVAAVHIIGNLVKRDLSFSTIRDILDLATSTHLQADFQWRPYYDLLFKHLPVIVSLLSHMFQPKHIVAGYGSFSFDISNDLGREEVHLSTRTKVSVDITLSGALSATLALDAAGLLPRFSRAWDLIPFTFMVNWVTGVGKMLSEVETIGFAALVPASYVHSFTITSPFQKGELEKLGASPLGETTTGLRVYIRDITLNAPVPRLSRFPFGLPSKYPSVGLLGSLFYQLFLS
jgi:hypothetical protein